MNGRAAARSGEWAQHFSQMLLVFYFVFIYLKLFVYIGNGVLFVHAVCCTALRHAERNSQLINLYTHRNLLFVGILIGNRYKSITRRLYGNVNKRA